MIQEYLFIDDTHREDVEAYAPAGVQVELYKIENSTCWTATYSLPGENEESAKRLSEVNDYIMGHFKPTVLTNESSAYFNKKLFPVINGFERRLRKLLYLKSALYSGEKKFENIRDLESKDMGEIFQILFTDEKFIKNTRMKVNEKTWQFSKKEILSVLADIDEDTVWKNLLGEGAVKALADNFDNARNYRNGVMHARNVDVETYREAKRLFTRINKQIDVEIGAIIQIAEEQPEKTETANFNMLLSSAIEAQSNVSLWDQLGKLFISTMGDHPSPLREAMEKMMEAHSSAELSGVGKALQRYSEMSNALYSASLQETAKKIREYQDSLYSPELREMMRSIKENQKRIMDAQRLTDLPRNEETSQESKDSQEEENDA